MSCQYRSSLQQTSIDRVSFRLIRPQQVFDFQHFLVLFCTYSIKNSRLSYTSNPLSSNISRNICHTYVHEKCACMVVNIDGETSSDNQEKLDLAHFFLFQVYPPQHRPLWSLNVEREKGTLGKFVSLFDRFSS